MIDPLYQFLTAHALYVWGFLWLCVGAPLALFALRNTKPPQGDEALIVILFFCLLTVAWPANVIYQVGDYLLSTPKPKPPQPAKKVNRFPPKAEL